MERAWPVDSKWAVRAMEDWSGCGLGWVEAAVDCFRGFAGDCGGPGIGSRDAQRVARIGGKFGGQIRELAGTGFFAFSPFRRSASRKPGAWMGARRRARGMRSDEGHGRGSCG
jgi:hypothetical protein